MMGRWAVMAWGRGKSDLRSRRMLDAENPTCEVGGCREIAKSEDGKDERKACGWGKADLRSRRMWCVDAEKLTCEVGRSGDGVWTGKS